MVIVYDHHKFDINNNLNELQHDYHHVIISSQHVHLSSSFMSRNHWPLKGKASRIDRIDRKNNSP
ncbi:MAG: hypothetical protein HC906_14060 [Bacteroidales bacterium]|nr:hypothetical protein [Bacteroidales bacterium]